MRKTIGTTIESALDDLGYTTRRALTFVGGKAGAQAGSLWVLGPALGGAIGYLTGMGEAATALVTEMVTVASVMGVSAGLVQMDHIHRKAQLVDRYREEIGHVTGKTPGKVSEVDLLDVANGNFRKNIVRNPTLRQALKQSSLTRNIGVVISAVAAAATYFLVHAAFDALAGGHAPTLLDAKSIPEGIAHLASHGLAGFMTYNIIKQPLHYVAGKVLGLREETVDEEIASIKHTRATGRMVSQEQVLDVYIEAHPDIGKSIEMDYGKEFADMNVAEKIRVIDAIPKAQFDLRKVTEDINLGHIKPEELAFMAFGQESGVERKQTHVLPKRPPVVDGLWNFLSGLTAGWTAPAREVTSEEVATALPGLQGKTDYTIYSPDENTAAMAIQNTQEHEGAKRRFAAMVGRKHTPEGISHVERYEQSLQQPDVLLNR